MVEKGLVVILPLVFLGSFISRNLIVKSKIKQNVRASDGLLKASMGFSTLGIFMTIFAVWSDGFYSALGKIDVLRSPAVSVFGLCLYGVGIVMGWIFSAHLKDSWRVGVPSGQKTELVETGIYGYIRNPYFLSYYLMFISLFLVRPCYGIGVVTLACVFTFHGMVLKEEIHLLKSHGEAYRAYQKKAGRYFPRLG